MTYTIRKITRLKSAIHFRDSRETLKPMQMEHRGLTPVINPLMRTTLLTTSSRCLMPQHLTSGTDLCADSPTVTADSPIPHQSAASTSTVLSVAYRCLNQFVSSLLRLPPILRLSLSRRIFLTVYSSAEVNYVYPAAYTSTPTRGSQEEVPTKIIGVLATVSGTLTKQQYPRKKSLSSTLRAINWSRTRILVIKPTRRTDFSNLFLEWNSTCFGQFLCSSSGVLHCTHSNGVCHTGLLTVCKQDQDGTPDPARKLSANLYDIYHCCVYSEKLLKMDRGTVRNM